MISFTWKYSIFQVIQIFIIICYFLQFLFCIGFGYNDVTINILQYELLLIFLWSLFSAIHESGTFNLYVLFLYMLCVFIYSRIFLDIYGLFNWTWADKYNDFIFPINVQFQILILLTFSLLFMHLGCLMGRKYLSYRKINFEYSRYLDKISTFLFLFSVPGTFIKYLIQFKAVLEHGYLAVYDGTIANLKYPIWTTGAISIFEFSYCLFLASKPSKKKFFIISSIFFALRIADVLKGGRSKLFLPIIFLLWYYYSFYSEQQKQKIGKLLLISIVCIILSQVLLEFRRGDVDTGYDSDLFMMFFSQQGVSFHVFDNHPLIDEIAIVVHPNYLEKVEELCCINNFKKVGRILQGGSERYYSSLSAINAYASTENDINLIFHDSVRPLVTKRIISDCITMLGKYGAVDVAIPATDTIIKMNLNTHEIEDIPNRQFLYNGQTPQAFKLSVIREAYKRALVDPNFKTTDDCGVVLKYMPDIPIGVVPGEKFNMKLTHKEDLFLLDKLFQLKSVSDVSLYGQETALEHKVIVIFGGSYGIGHSIAELCTGLKAKVYSFSRSETGTDVADASLVKEALEKVYLIEKKIDFVINTAGILLKIPLMTMKYDDILNLIRVNYLGAINVAKESFSYLAKSHGGLLLFTSSSYTRGRAMYSLYSSSKAAIVNLVQALSEEWKSYNIKINCINPERTKTPMRIQNFGIEPENSLLSPQFVAETSIMTLLSGLTGQVIDVRRKTD